MFSFLKSANCLKSGVVSLIIAASLSGCSSLSFTQADMNLIGSDSTSGIMRLFVIDNPADTLVLRSVSTDLTKEDLQSEYYSILKKRMMATVLDTANTGVGIAAPQVGINKRLIIVQRIDKVGGPYEFYVNPKLLELSKEKSLIREGCLSVPNRSDSVMRSNKVVVSYLDEKSLTEKIDTVGGFSAIIFQHEIDHLEGVLYIDKAASGNKSPDINLLYGSWVEPNPINDKEVQGLKLNNDGTASSINMATLQYKSWKLRSGQLVLISESIGNGISFRDTTTYDIVQVDRNNLKIKNRCNNSIIEYSKR